MAQINHQGHIPQNKLGHQPRKNQKKSLGHQPNQTAKQIKLDYAIQIQTFVALQDQGLTTLPKKTWA